MFDCTFKLLLTLLTSLFFSKLHPQTYEPQLFRLCVQCLIAVAKALSPDSDSMSHTEVKALLETDGKFDPQPVDTTR